MIHSYLYVTGRSKDIINKGGEVISPSEVEDAIMATAGDLVKVWFFSTCLSSVFRLIFCQIEHTSIHH